MKKINPVGIMQGRLSPPVNKKIQAFPKTSWKDEFKIAKTLGFDAMELIFDGIENPLFNLKGLREVRALADESGIIIPSVCTDFTMYHPLHGTSRRASIGVIKKLIKYCRSISIMRIGISFEDNSAIMDARQRDQALASMKELTKAAEDSEIILTIETSLSPCNVIAFLERVGSHSLKVNFDTGNSCAQGENPAETLRILGPRVGGIHIKDRSRLFGKTISLGQGEVNFKDCFSAIKEIHYSGPLIIQGARGNNDIATAKRYLEFVKNLLYEN